ncbi:MAG: DUF1365 domain-containing protein [Gammaproteobacteria bacterium]|jgi:DUF1365 family protein
MSGLVHNRIYRGRVMHRRLGDPPYRFAYPVFSFLLDIDRLAETAGSCRLFSYNRRNLFAFYDRDHGARDGSPLRPWVERHLTGQGIDLDGGRIQLLCFPRLLGFTFNPLSLWYCHRSDGALVAVLCEVHNTFGESHGYLLHDRGRALVGSVRAAQRKSFHVSPFLPMDLRYRFRLSRPGSRLHLAIRCYREDAPTMAAAHTAEALPFSDAALVRTFARTPFMTFKVVAMIHWQAFKLWLRRARLYHKPAPPAQEVTPCSAKP